MIILAVIATLLTPVSDLDLYSCDELNQGELLVTDAGIVYCIDYTWTRLDGQPLFNPYDYSEL